MADEHRRNLMREGAPHFTSALKLMMAHIRAGDLEEAVDSFNTAEGRRHAENLHFAAYEDRFTSIARELPKDPQSHLLAQAYLLEHAMQRLRRIGVTHHCTPEAGQPDIALLIPNKDYPERTSLELSTILSELAYGIDCLTYPQTEPGIPTIDQHGHLQVVTYDLSDEPLRTLGTRGNPESLWATNAGQRIMLQREGVHGEPPQTNLTLIGALYPYRFTSALIRASVEHSFPEQLGVPGTADEPASELPLRETNRKHTPYIFDSIPKRAQRFANALILPIIRTLDFDTDTKPIRQDEDEWDRHLPIVRQGIRQETTIYGRNLVGEYDISTSRTALYDPLRGTYPHHLEDRSTHMETLMIRPDACAEEFYLGYDYPESSIYATVPETVNPPFPVSRKTKSSSERIVEKKDREYAESIRFTGDNAHEQLRAYIEKFLRFADEYANKQAGE